jgi:hypothetical protein
MSIIYKLIRGIISAFCPTLIVRQARMGLEDEKATTGVEVCGCAVPRQRREQETDLSLRKSCFLCTLPPTSSQGKAAVFSATCGRSVPGYCRRRTRISQPSAEEGACSKPSGLSSSVPALWSPFTSVKIPSNTNISCSRMVSLNSVRQIQQRLMPIELVRKTCGCYFSGTRVCTVTCIA